MIGLLILIVSNQICILFKFQSRYLYMYLFIHLHVVTRNTKIKVLWWHHVLLFSSLELSTRHCWLGKTRYGHSLLLYTTCVSILMFVTNHTIFRCMYYAYCGIITVWHFFFLFTNPKQGSFESSNFSILFQAKAQ